MMRSLLCFLVICVYSMSTLAKARTFDRLVLEIREDALVLHEWVSQPSVEEKPKSPGGRAPSAPCLP